MWPCFVKLIQSGLMAVVANDELSKCSSEIFDEISLFISSLETLVHKCTHHQKAMTLWNTNSKQRELPLY